MIGSTPHDVLLPLLCDYGHDKKLLDDYDNPLSSSYSKMARDIAGMERLSMVHWREAHFPSEKDLFSEQEAHSTVLLTSPSMKMYLGIVPGVYYLKREFTRETNNHRQVGAKRLRSLSFSMFQIFLQ